VIVSSVNIETGEYNDIELDQEFMSVDQIVSSIVASAAVPMAFPPENMNKYDEPQVLMDGGTVWNINMETGIRACMSMEGIESPSQIEIDIIDCNGNSLTEFEGEHNTVKNLSRAWQIRKYYSSMNDIREFMRANPEPFFRYFV